MERHRRGLDERVWPSGNVAADAFISPQYGWYYLWLLPLLSVTIETVTPLQFTSAAFIAYGYVRYHLAGKLTPDLLLAPVASGLSLYQCPSVQWFWLLLIASAAFLSWI